MNFLYYLFSNLGSLFSWYNLQNIIIVVAIFFASYLLSFIFWRKEKDISTIVRLLCGQAILINLGFVILLGQLLSKGTVLATFLATIGLIVWLRKIPIHFLYTKLILNPALKLKSNIVYLVITLLFLVLLPRVYNGLYKSDELAFHLAYPQYWINAAGFKIDYSQRYPVYAFGMHIIYTFLMLFGNATTVKLYSAFFFLLFLFGIQKLIQLVKAPQALGIFFAVTILTASFFSEFSFSAYLEPYLWVYTLFLIIELRQVICDANIKIAEGKIHSFLPLLLLSAAVICIKHIFLVYVSIYMLLLAVIYTYRHYNRLGNLIRFVWFAFIIIMTPNLVNFFICYYYSGDPLFPMLTVKFPHLFPRIYDIRDVKQMADCVHIPSIVKFIDYFYFPIMDPVLTLTLVFGSILFLLLWFNIKTIQSARREYKEHLFILLWCVLSLIATQFLFPNFTRYFHFLLPGFIICCLLLYKFVSKWAVIAVCFSLFFYNYFNDKIKLTIGFYTLPIKTENLYNVDPERIFFGDNALIDLFAYLHTNKNIDTINIIELAQFKYVFMLDKKTIYGDETGVYRYDKMCSCRNAKYLLTPKVKTEFIYNCDLTCCDLIYENKDYLIYKKQTAKL